MKKLFLTLLLLSIPSLAMAEDDKAFNRVISTGIINCGYGNYKPWIYADPLTGKVQGLMAEIMEGIAKELSLKLNWPDETGWANLPEALRTGKVDVACSTMWRDPSRSKMLSFTRPIFYTSMHAYVRADDKRFKGKSINEINNANVSIVVQDGDYSSQIAERSFPLAKTIDLPQMASEADKLTNVATGKADVVFSDNLMIEGFNENNEKKLKRIPFEHPLAVYANVIPVSIDELKLKEMLDSTIAYMHDTGKIEQITKEFRQKNPQSIILPKSDY
jgi:polar amino acid transport system substrate-binding protein